MECLLHALVLVVTNAVFYDGHSTKPGSGVMMPLVSGMKLSVSVSVLNTPPPAGLQDRGVHSLA
jgi:hypothetical protein